MTKGKILVLMTLSMFLGYLPWYNFSAVLKYIAADFDLSGADIGIILASIQFGYVLVVIFTGWLSDKVGEIKIITWATLLTAVFSTSFVWLARDFTSILLLRLLTGVSAGAIYAPGISYLSSWFPPEERGKAIGAYTAALTASYAGGYFVASPLAGKYGWQSGILWTSLPVFFAAAILFYLMKVGNPGPGSLEKASSLPAINTDRAIKAAPEGGYSGPALITTSYMGHMWELYAFWGWIGPFLVACTKAAGYSDSVAVALGGKMAALVILLGVPAVFLWGMAADKWGRTKAIMIGASCSLSVELFLGFLYGHSLIFVVLAAFWIGFWVISDSAIYKAGLTDMVSPQIRSTALGFQSALGYIMTIISPFLFGKVLEIQNGNINPVDATKWGLPFFILGLGAVIAPLAAFVLRKIPQARLMTQGKM
ncbi:MAG: MFS transporter [Peptococcaceae bacterium]